MVITHALYVLLSSLCWKNTESLIGIHLCIVLLLTTNSTTGISLPRWVYLVDCETPCVLCAHHVLLYSSYGITHFLGMSYAC